MSTLISPGVSTVIRDENIYSPTTEEVLYPHILDTSMLAISKKILLNSIYGNFNKKEMKDMISDKKNAAIKKITKVNLTKLLKLLNRFSIGT